MRTSHGGISEHIQDESIFEPIRADHCFCVLGTGSRRVDIMCGRSGIKLTCGDYLPVLLQQAGIMSPDRQRVLSFVYSITSSIGALTGVSTIDYLGRRALMLTAAGCCSGGLAIIGGLMCNTRASAGISFLCVSTRPVQLHSSHPLSSFHGAFFFRMDTSSGSVPHPRSSRTKYERKVWHCK